MALPLIQFPDMFSSGKSAHGYGHVVQTTHQDSRSLAVDYITNCTAQAGIPIKKNTSIVLPQPQNQ